MIAMSIAERRNITPAIKLNEQLESSKRSRHFREGNKSSKYHMDMNSRKLPPPLVFYSDSEKDAWIKNRNEQSRLDKVLDHLHIQAHVYEQIFDKEANVVKTRSQKFMERVRGRITSAGGGGEKEETGNTSSPEPEVETMSRAQSAGSEVYTYQIQTRHGGIIRKTMTKPSTAWADQTHDRNKGLFEMIEDDDDDDLISLVASEGPLSSTGSVYRPFSAIAATRPKTTRDPSKRKVRSAYPVSKLPKVASNNSTSEPREEQSSRSPSRSPPRSPSRSGPGRKGRPGVYCSSRAEDQLKRELKEMRRRRLEQKPAAFSFTGALERERTHYAKTEAEIKGFYDKVKEMKKQPLSKWELRNIEARLKLW